MNMFEQNLIYIKGMYPNLLNVVLNDTLDVSYEVIPSANGMPNLKLQADETIYYLHSKYDPQIEAEKWLANMSNNGILTDQVLLFGIGMGYFLEALLGSQEIKRIAVLEPDIQAFNALLRHRSLQTLLSDNKIKMIAVGAHELILAELAETITKTMTGELSIVAPPVYQRLNPDKLKWLREKVQESVINDISNLQTYEKFQKTWLENILRNIPFTVKYPSVLSFKDVLKGGNVVVVGSGPSLEIDVQYLRELKNKCFIIAAGSSIQALQHFEIDPDLVVTMDGGRPNLFVFQKVDSTKTPLVFIPQTYFEVLDHYHNDLAFATFEEDPVSEYLYRDREVPRFRATASVTGTALQLADYMGAKQIIMLGQDLSYPEDKFYSSGVRHLSETTKSNVLKGATDWVDNVLGGKNRSTPVMTLTRKNIEMNIKALELKGIKVINSSRGGAVIEGTDWIPMDVILKDMIGLPHMDLDICQLMRARPDSEQLEIRKSMINKLRRILQQVEVSEKLLQDLRKDIQKLKKERNYRNLDSVSRGLVKVNERWQVITANESFLFYSFGTSHFVNSYMKHIPAIVEVQNPLAKAELIVAHLGELVDQLIAFGPELKHLLSNAIERLESLTEDLNGIIGRIE
ncbi:MAG: 6-hydroxymethylpterin diphosphokinase MptE-like protein [Paenibacillus sp.]|uniref:motility associated factor glycosyltransferase family protein n=1 Tax=Paenibacillus sp. TaxID=58172 RepID=UPI00290E1D1B|nr:6-hydroxymethylpterin diphosphokinase MptE-like protein [Paenibacillus sp.]MDU4695595.1 6-hydroxymethylpterin diphosphokinase MptE-like protein [Paenibacillus sp.]